MTTKMCSRQRSRRRNPVYSAMSMTLMTTICMTRSIAVNATDVSPETPAMAPVAPPAAAPVSTPFDFSPVVFITEVPTFSPTVNPTVSPTRRPSAPPTVTPTVSPTPKSSPSPSKEDFGGPSLQMPVAPVQTTPTPSLTTLSPSEASSKPSAETPSPSEQPTSMPSLFASMYPSLAPSDPPSTIPSIQGSGDPSQAPTTAPTLELSLYPSDAPSFVPSTSFPSVIPSSTPTNAPSVKRSKIPTSLPSLFPTGTPSVSPSVTPSAEPSLFPTSSPTDSAFPSLLPTSAPSDVPSAEPSSAPSLSLQGDLIDVVMLFDDAQTFLVRSQITWGSVTEEHIRDSIVAQNLDPPLFDPRVRILLDRMYQPTSAPATRRRSLQQSPLVLEFKTDVQYRSFATYNVSLLVGGAFDSSSERSSYLQRLQQSGDRSFSSINDLTVSINGVTQQVKEPTEPGGGGGSGGGDGGTDSMLFIIIGAVCGGVALAIVGVIWYMRNRQQQKKVKRQPPNTLVTSDSGPERINTDIVVDNQDDISTLGDPSILGGLMQMGVVEKDETTNVASIVSGDYDYAKQFGTASGAAPRSEAGSAKYLLGSMGESDRDVSTQGDLSTFLPRTDNSLFSDDASFEDQFKLGEELYEVIAPSGKLGMVIDTPAGGVPVVHAIKEVSPLATTVRVGDRLMSVDDEDTTGMTAMQVSRLISAKAALPSRKLVFARSRNRADSMDVKEILHPR